MKDTFRKFEPLKILLDGSDGALLWTTFVAGSYVGKTCIEVNREIPYTCLREEDKPN